MKSKVFFLIILLSSPIIQGVNASDYGEDSESLGQFVDDYGNSNYVSSSYQVINNLTLECMELNYSAGTIYSDDRFQLREHKCYASYTPVFSYSIADTISVYQSSTNPSLGHSYQFVVIKNSYLDGKYLRYRWRQYCSQDSPGVVVAYSWIYDGAYDRSNNTHFPDGSAIITFGNGLLQTLGSTPQDWGWSDWETEDHLVDVSGGSEENVTILFRLHDAWGSQNTGLQIDWIEINDGAGGTDNLYTFDFETATNIVMENTGTAQDYGYVNNSGLPIEFGGYGTGYFNTTDYLDDLKGKSLVWLTNATIPEGTSLTIEFSSDGGSSWVNDQGVAGYNSLNGGFEALDLRDLNYADLTTRYNFTGTNTLTPRLYQSRLITTEGEGGIIQESDTPWIAIAIILMMIAFLLFGGKR